MLLPIPPAPRHRRSDRARIPPPIPPAVVNVTDVQIVNPVTLLWVFSSAITSCAANCPQLLADNGDGAGFRPPVSVEPVGDDPINSLAAVYEETVFDGDFAYQIVDPPQGLVFADGTLILPQPGGT